MKRIFWPEYLQWPQIKNILLRIIILASRFLFILIIAAYLPPEEVGLYGLLVATVGYACIPLGLDFYTYTAREIAVTKRTKDYGLRGPGKIYLATYVICFPLLSLLFYYEILPWEIAFYFFVITTLEHLNLESYRLLLAISQPLSAAVSQLIKTLGLTFSAFLLMYISEPQRNLESILFFWALFSGLSLWYSLHKLTGADTTERKEKITLYWLWKGVKVASPFLLGNLALRLLFSLDRHLFEGFNGIEVLAAYTLFGSLAAALLALVEAGITAFYYPKLMQLYQANNPRKFRNEVRKMSAQTIQLILIFGVTILPIINFGIQFFDSQIYTQHITLAYWLLAASSVYALSLVPHYALYAQHIDRPITIVHIASAPLFLVFVYSFGKLDRINAVPQALIVTFSIIALYKLVIYLNAPEWTSKSEEYKRA